MPKRSFLLAGPGVVTAAAAALLFASAASAGCANAATVSTAAGSGAFGNADGPASAATFMMPAGIAVERDGTLVVSDAAGQRIRSISRNGTVTTIAGLARVPKGDLSLRGGYLDGPGSAAQFSHPTGVAVDRAGNIYVADTLNHCIRKIDRNGNVTTYAGSAQAGSADGPRLSARFVRPEGIAVDGAGNVYVADPGTGLRKIAAAGDVTTIDRDTTADNTVICVAAYNTSRGPTVFVGERYGLFALAPDGSKQRFPGARDFDAPPLPAAPAPNLERPIQARKPLGHPAAITAINDHTVAFTDAVTNTVRVLETIHGTLRIVGGAPVDDASGDTAAFRDGEATAARFDAPLGIASDAVGRLYVADAGNRRIRLLSGVDYRYGASVAHGLLEPMIGESKKEYRIAYIGNSLIWYNTEWADSIEGQIEQKLKADHALGNKNVRIVPIGGIYTFASASDYTKLLAEAGAADLVVWNINFAYLIASFGDPVHSSALHLAWETQVTAGVRALQAQLRAQGVSLIVVTYPISLDWAESAYSGMLNDYSDFPVSGPVEQRLNDAIRSSNVPLIELRPRFISYEMRANHAAVYGELQFHLSINGRRLVGAWVAEELEKLAPWARH